MLAYFIMVQRQVVYLFSSQWKSQIEAFVPVDNFYVNNFPLFE